MAQKKQLKKTASTAKKMLKASAKGPVKHTRREFVHLTTAAMGAAGVGVCAASLLNTMNPSAEVEALASIEVDISSLQPGQAMTVKWRGKPVFIKNRTPEEIQAAREVVLTELPDPQKDEDRVKKDQYLVMVGVCTHLGCIPSGQKLGDTVGDYGGWFCPCHGSHYDTSGRIRKGPAPSNLQVPPYQFVSDTVIRIG